MDAGISVPTGSEGADGCSGAAREAELQSIRSAVRDGNPDHARKQLGERGKAQEPSASSIRGAIRSSSSRTRTTRR